MDNNKALILFDFGNVLALHDRLDICARFARHSPLSPGQIASRVFDSDIERDSETGKYDSREHFRRISSAIKGDPDWTYDQFVEEYKNVFVLNDEAVRALAYAAKRCSVSVLSNTTYLHSLWLFEQEMLATIPESYIFSYKVSVMKPDPRIWRIALARSGVSPSRCLYIDDLQRFCRAAEELGLRAIHYRKGETDLMAEVDGWIREVVPAADAEDARFDLSTPG